MDTELEDLFGNVEEGEQGFHKGCGGTVVIISENEWGCHKCGAVVSDNDIEIVAL